MALPVAVIMRSAPKLFNMKSVRDAISRIVGLGEKVTKNQWVKGVRDFISRNPVSSSTIATLIATGSPELYEYLVKEAEPTEREALKSILDSMKNYANDLNIDLDADFGDGEPGIKGINKADVTAVLDAQERQAEIVEWISAELGIPKRSVVRLVLMIRALEPELAVRAAL